ncbi:MAG: hypothetical protein MZU97_01160 [Bacillus subtilis]|nr:hypothetical protein [Bacillus subtilis]
MRDRNDDDNHSNVALDDFDNYDIVILDNALFHRPSQRQHPQRLEGTSQSTTVTTTALGWDGKRVTYPASVIRNFGSGTPAGTTNYNTVDNTVAIWNIDASLDNYGGIQTPTMALDFSKAVIFQMDVVGVYSQYIVKLAVAGESEYYYVLSDDGRTGIVSINVVDAMLSQKYRQKEHSTRPGIRDRVEIRESNQKLFVPHSRQGSRRRKANRRTRDSKSHDHQRFDADHGTFDRIERSVEQSLNETQERRRRSTDGRGQPANGHRPKRLLDESRSKPWRRSMRSGLVQFVGVGVTQIQATSLIDQSKSTSIVVDVLSGYEQPAALQAGVAALQYGNSSQDTLAFLDLFKTTWGTQLRQDLVSTPSNALSSRFVEQTLLSENYFTAANAGHVLEATNQLGPKARPSSPSNWSGLATRRCIACINGKLVPERSSGTLRVAYADNQSGWRKLSSYSEQGIVVWDDGRIAKYELRVEAVTMIASYDASRFANPTLWTIPDRTKQTLDPVVHALSPASVTIRNNLAVLRQNKYPEAKYCFGGIASNLFQASPNRDVRNRSRRRRHQSDSTTSSRRCGNSKSSIIKAMAPRVVSSNPIETRFGEFNRRPRPLPSRPAYTNFRIYLVVNGSDIGAQFSGADDANPQFKDSNRSTK